MQLQISSLIIIPVDYGDSAPMTHEDHMLFLGIFIFLNVLWIISWGIFGIRCLIYSINFKKQNHKIKYYDDSPDRWMGNGIISELINPFFDSCMICFWAIVIIAFFGNLISSLF